jgi:hypothetical protein
LKAAVGRIGVGVELLTATQAQAMVAELLAWAQRQILSR